MLSYDMKDSNFVYKMSRLDGTDKQGILRPDEGGWYTICIGALDHASKNVNKSGQNEYYSSEGAESFFAPGTLFNDRIQGGFVKAEYGHPKREAGMTDIQFLERNMQIEETKVCATFGAIWLVPGYIDPLTKEKCVGIFAKIKPSGTYGKFLEQDLQEKGFNVCFSIRSLTTRKNMGGRNVKVLHTVITFDYVTEPGITCAEKLISPSCESVNHVNAIDTCDVEVTAESAKRVVERAEAGMVSVESSTLSILTDIFKHTSVKPVKQDLSKSFSW